MFNFNVEGSTQNQSSDKPVVQVDWKAYNEYLVNTVGTQKKAKSMIGIVSGVIDLGLQVQEDAKMEWKGTDEELAEVEAKAAAGESTEYFETLPNDQGVPTLYKRWKVKPCQQVAITVDFPGVMLDRGQFFGDDSGTEHPLRMLLNGEFYLQGVGRIVGKPYNVKEVKNPDGSWSFKNNTQIYKLAAATDSLDEQGKFKPFMLGKLLGKAALYEVQVFNKKGSDGKEYLQEKIKLVGQVPDVMESLIPELDSQYIYGVNFKGEQNPEILKQLRQSVINTMKQAENFEGSDVQKALIEAGKITVGEQQQAPQEQAKQEEKPQAKVVAKKAEPAPDYDSFDDDIPFMNPYFGNRSLIV